MKQYSERQLLMLSNFVYVPVSVSTATIGEIIDNYRDESGSFSVESVAPAGYGGGMDSEETAELFACIDEEIKKDPAFGELSASRILEENDVRAICYTDKKDNNPVVAFRGTGGTKEAWSDNLEGEYESETRIQKVAGDFISKECDNYDSLTVTGHSKGGNMAMFVTVECQDKVKSCVSFDGQGFGKTYIQEHKSEIESASGKIKSISAYNDYVNILLWSIAGQNLYVNNKKGIEYGHSSISLLTENDYDEKGNFISFRKQGFLAKELNTTVDELAAFMGILPVSDREILADVGGDTITGAFEMQGDDKLKETYNLVSDAVGDFIHKKFYDDTKENFGEVALFSEQVCIYWDEVHKCVCVINSITQRVGTIKRRMDEMRDDFQYTLASKIYTDKIIARAIDSLEYFVKMSGEYCALLEEIAARYKQREQSLKAF